MSYSSDITTFSKISDLSFDYCSKLLSNTWNYVVTHPLSNGGNYHSLSCSDQKLIRIQKRPIAYGPLRIIITHDRQNSLIRTLLLWYQFKYEKIVLKGGALFSLSS